MKSSQAKFGILIFLLIISIWVFQKVSDPSATEVQGPEILGGGLQKKNRDRFGHHSSSRFKGSDEMNQRDGWQEGQSHNIPRPGDPLIMIPDLMRLSDQRDPAAREKALELLKSGDKRLSIIALRALHPFDDERVNKELTKLTRSKDPEIQWNAISALAWNLRSDSIRKVILEDYIKSPVALKLHSLMALGALYRSTQDTERSAYINQAIILINKEKSAGERYQAARTLLQMDPNSPLAHELMARIENELQTQRRDIRPSR